MDNKELWAKAMVDIELEVSKANFSTWFKNTRIVKQDAGTVYIGVQNEFVRDWLINKYNSTVLRILRNLSADIKGVEYIIAKEDMGEKSEQTPKKEEQESQYSYSPVLIFGNSLHFPFMLHKWEVLCYPS